MLQPEVHQRVPPELDESVLVGSGSRFDIGPREARCRAADCCVDLAQCDRKSSRFGLSPPYAMS